MTTKWERLEEYLYDYDLAGDAFTSIELATQAKIDRREASRWIEDYQQAMASPRLDTLYVIRREGRTRNARWHVGVRAADASKLGQQTARDFRCRLDRAVAPALTSLMIHNPRAARRAEAVLHALHAGVELLVSMLDGDET